MAYLEKDEKNGLRIVGKLTSENVSEIQNHLNEVLYSTNRLIIDLKAVEEIDITGLYMLFIFKKDAFLKGKQVTILLQETPLILNLYKNSGLASMMDDSFNFENKSA